MERTKILNKLEEIQKFIDSQGKVGAKYSDSIALSFVQQDLTKLKKIVNQIMRAKDE